MSKDPNQNSWVQEEEWNDITLEKSGKDKYLAVFTSDTTSYSIPVQMVQRGAEYQESYQKYQAELKAYQQRKEKVDNMRAANNQLVRTFNVSRMGIYNYDVFWKQTESIPLFADFDFGDVLNQLSEDVTVFLITGDQRTVVSYPYANWQRFRFDPQQDNALVAVLPDNKVATFTQADFNAQQAQLEAANGQEFTFDMHVREEPISSLEDLREIL